jgi:predicted P-loop ATPase
LHCYFKKPVGFSIKKSLKQYPGIDFLSKGCFVVIPPAVNPDTGNKYIVMDDIVIAQAPQKLLDLIHKDAKNEQAPETSRDIPKAEDRITPANYAYRIGLFKERLPATLVEGERAMSMYRIGCMAFDLGLDKQTIIEELIKWNEKNVSPPMTLKELEHQIDSAEEYKKSKSPTPVKKEDIPEIKLDFTMTGKIKPTYYTLCTILTDENSKLKGVFRFNDLTHDIEPSRPLDFLADPEVERITDTEVLSLKYYLAQTLGLDFTTPILWEAIKYAAKKRTYNPLKSYIQNLSWDGKKRLNDFFINVAGAEKSDYTRMITRKFMCGAVTRATTPGSKFDFMLVLEGAQGLGKSTFCNNLGGKFFTEYRKMITGNKDDVINLQGKWIVEMSELGKLKRTDAGLIKAFITCQVDRVRMPYDRTAMDFKRTCVFIGSVNPDQSGYLSDPTENRRYWILPVYQFDWDIINDKDYLDQVVAEAKVCLMRGEKLYLDDPKVAKKQAEICASRTLFDPWTKTLRDYVKDEDITELSAYEVLHSLFGISKARMTTYDITRVKQCFVKIGWLKKDDTEEEDEIYERIFKTPPKDDLYDF